MLDIPPLPSPAERGLRSGGHVLLPPDIGHVLLPPDIAVALRLSALGVLSVKINSRRLNNKLDLYTQCLVFTAREDDISQQFSLSVLPSYRLAFSLVYMVFG